MQTDSKIFASDAERRAFIRSLEVSLCEGKPDEAFRLATDKARGLTDRSGKLRGIGDAHLDQLRLSAIPPFAHSPATTAISFDLSWPGHFGSQPDRDGNLTPIVETNYFSDGAFVFSTANRAEYVSATASRAPWVGAFDDIGGGYDILGLEREYGLVQKLAAIKDRTPEEEDCYCLNAAIAAIMAHLAVKQTIMNRGLDAPVAILVGSNEDYPYFVAPVVTYQESRGYVFSTEDFHESSVRSARSPSGQASPRDEATISHRGSTSGPASGAGPSGSTDESSYARAERWADDTSQRMADALGRIVTDPSARRALTAIGSVALTAAELASSSPKAKQAFGKLREVLNKL